MSFWRKCDRDSDMTEGQRAFDKVRRSPEYAEHWKRLQKMNEEKLDFERKRMNADLDESASKWSRAQALRDLQDRNNIW